MPIRITSLCCALCLYSGLLLAQGPSYDTRDLTAAVNRPVVERFSVDETVAVRFYYSHASRDLLDDLARNEAKLPSTAGASLLPGRQLTLSLQKLFVALPSELADDFSPLPPGWRRGAIGVRAVILDQRNVIRDLFRIPVPPARPPASAR